MCGAIHESLRAFLAENSLEPEDRAGNFVTFDRLFLLNQYYFHINECGVRIITLALIEILNDVCILLTFYC